MIYVPSRYTLLAGCGTGPTPLNAFDTALYNASVGNYNLVRVSSILPPGAKESSVIDAPPGALLPIAYASFTTTASGKEIAAAVGVGVATSGPGVIMEFHGICSEDEAVTRVKEMVAHALDLRGTRPAEVKTASCSLKTGGPSAVFAGVVMW